MTEHSAEPDPSITSSDLAPIAELLAVLDVFLRSDPVPEVLAAHLHTIGADHPRYDAALLIDQVSFTAHALRSHRRTAASQCRPRSDADQDIDDL